MQLIAGSVAFQFLQPPVAPVLGRGAILATAMTMPETADGAGTGRRVPASCPCRECDSCSMSGVLWSGGPDSHRKFSAMKIRVHLCSSVVGKNWRRKIEGNKTRSEEHTSELQSPMYL